MPNLKRTPLALAVSLAVAESAVQAQEPTNTDATDDTPVQADGRPVEEVIVTCWQEGDEMRCGLLQSLRQSMAIKRAEDGVVDAITAEDIGDFPDSNLAESLQRITGVSIDRDRGEGARVTVRGFGPDFNLVLLNGRQMPTSSGLGRSFDFGDLASEGVATVQVYKSGRADVPTGGVGSTINILTTQPLAEPGMRFSATASGLYDRSGDGSFTPELSALFSNTFADDRVGVALSAVRQERDSGTNTARVDGWRTFPGEVHNCWGLRNRPGGLGRHPTRRRPQPAEPARGKRPLLRATGDQLRARGLRARAYQRPTHAAMASH